MRIQARDLIRTAKKHGHKLTRSFMRECAVATLCQQVGLSFNAERELIFEKVPGLTNTDLVALELGFEGWTADQAIQSRIRGRFNYEFFDLYKKNRYYRVGRNAAKLAGYTV